MLIPLYELQAILSKCGIDKVTGVLHIGSHDCEEMEVYRKLGLNEDDIVWIDAIEEKVQEAKLFRGMKNVYQAVITDKDGDTVTFHVSNNIQSSSVLDLDLHKIEHPHIYYTHDRMLVTKTIDTFMSEISSSFDSSKLNMWNIDIQGAELQALKGGIKTLQSGKVDILYLEINEKSLYKDCALVGEIDDFLSSVGRGYKRVFTCLTHHGWGDAIYMKQ